MTTAMSTPRPRGGPGHRVSTLLAALLGVLALTTDANAERSLADYRYFRSLSIDLQGRMPTRAEIAAFEQDSFDLNGWIDQQLHTAAYADRVRRVYLDLLRLEVGGSFQFVQSETVLRRVSVLGPDGKPTNIYFRLGQRRSRPETDISFCLTQAETGVQFPHFAEPTGTEIPVSQAVLDKYTRVIKPWWLYRDYASQAPTDLYDAIKWQQKTPGFALAAGLVSDDGIDPNTQIRVCAEETELGPMAPITSSPFAGTCDPKAPPFGRLDCPPKPSAYETKHLGETVDCSTTTGTLLSAQCGCGVGLERCMPGAGSKFENAAFVLPSHHVAGMQAFDVTEQAQSSWARVFWGGEAEAFLQDIIQNDRDFRQVLTGKQTWVNGPLAQFYKSVAPGQCCGSGVAYGYTRPEPLLDPTKLPADLTPFDVEKWEQVPDRGPHAAGIMTMPVFLTKYGSRRARAHVLWNAFACKDFIAGNVALKPSTEPDLTKRDGCNLCHATLEPLSAYFSRIQESTWTFLPPDKFPTYVDKTQSPLAALTNSNCFYDPKTMTTTPSRTCTDYYDPAFTTPTTTTLRGAYSSREHADQGPPALAQYLTSTSQFESCVAQNMATAMLGRTLTADDSALQAQLADQFSKGEGGVTYSMRSLVRALVISEAYKKANNLSSTAWRNGGAK